MYAVEDLTEEQKTLLFVVESINGLAEQGLVKGVPTITPKGIALFDQLMATSWRATRKQVSQALSVLSELEVFGLEMVDPLLVLISHRGSYPLRKE